MASTLTWQELWGQEYSGYRNCHVEHSEKLRNLQGGSSLICFHSRSRFYIWFSLNSLNLAALGLLIFFFKLKPTLQSCYKYHPGDEGGMAGTSITPTHTGAWGWGWLDCSGGKLQVSSPLSRHAIQRCIGVRKGGLPVQGGRSLGTIVGWLFPRLQIHVQEDWNEQDGNSEEGLLGAQK